MNLLASYYSSGRWATIAVLVGCFLAFLVWVLYISWRGDCPPQKILVDQPSGVRMLPSRPDPRPYDWENEG